MPQLPDLRPVRQRTAIVPITQLRRIERVQVAIVAFQILNLITTVALAAGRQ
jgi:hypothetical protein